MALVWSAFETFWRGDAARGDTGRHAGLGLPLTARIVARLGGAITAAVDDGRFAVTVRLPRT